MLLRYILTVIVATILITSRRTLVTLVVSKTALVFIVSYSIFLLFNIYVRLRKMTTSPLLL